MLLTISSVRGSCGPTTAAPSRHGSGRGLSAWRRSGVLYAAKNRELQASIDPTPVEVATPERGAVHPGLVASGVACIAAAWVFLRKPEDARQKNEVAKADDETAYLLARARTRQAIYVQKAIGFSYSNLPARVMVELERALKENANCRSSVVNGLYRQEELEGLYRRHLQNSEVPPDFAVLLQLRNMLGISPEEAERLEKEVQQSNTFSI